MIVFVVVGGIIYIGSQLKFVFYVYEVDKFGQMVVVGLMIRVLKVDLCVIYVLVVEFVGDVCLVMLDVVLQCKVVYCFYVKFGLNDLVIVKMNEWFNGIVDVSLFVCVVVEMVSIEIIFVILQMFDIWQVDWVEMMCDR